MNTQAEARRIYAEVIGDITGKSRDKCIRCANCCRIKIKIDEKGYVTDAYCPGINLKTRLCMLYPIRSWRLSRLLTGIACQTAEQDIADGSHPSTCPMMPKGKTGIDMSTYVQLKRNARWYRREARRWLIWVLTAGGLKL